MKRVALWLAVVGVAYLLGYWSGVADERQATTIATCPKVEARWTGADMYRRLDTLTVIPEECR
jgi:hypothetical protein